MKHLTLVKFYTFMSLPYVNNFEQYARVSSIEKKFNKRFEYMIKLVRNYEILKYRDYIRICNKFGLLHESHMLLMLSINN